jgi:formylglycine-generating enzyme required for sulfatase activity
MALQTPVAGRPIATTKRRFLPVTSWISSSPGTASQYAIYGCNYGASADGCSGVGNIAPVGTAAKGAGLWGHLDLAGNTSEWLLDVYAPFATPCTDCASFAGGSGCVNRGGSFRSSATMYLQPSFRGDLLYGTNRTAQYEIRCARTP